MARTTPCDKCGKDAPSVFSYGGKWYCSPCFCDLYWVGNKKAQSA